MAGSEKVAKTNVKGQQLDEAKGINKSLSCLGKVINALTDKKQTHIPYRESKLTRILTESLGGNAKTCLIIACSPSSWNELETMTTLRFGTAARNIKNKPKVNREYTVEELKKMVAKRDKIIKVFANRVKTLEDYIQQNNLEVPTDEELANLSISNQKDNDNDIDDLPVSDDEDFNKDSQVFKQTNLFKYNENDKEDLKNTSVAQGGIPQEFLDKVVDLEDHLDREKERYNAQCDAMATLKEDFDILNSKFNVVDSEKESLENEKNSLILKLQGHLDQNEENEEIIKHMEIKIQSKIDELADFKKSNAKLNAKLKNFEGVSKGSKNAEKEEKKIEDEQFVSSESNIKLQKQILILQHKLKLNNEFINKIKRSETLTEASQNLLALNERQLEEIEEKEAKSKQSRIKKMLLNNEDLSDIEATDDSFYLSESEVGKLISNQKMIHQRIEDELASKRKIREEMEDLKVALNVALQEINPDIQSITTALVEDRVQEMKSTFDRERENLLSDLGNRVQKVCELELELDLIRDEYRRLENSMNGDDYSLKNQVSQLQRQMEQINLMYHNSLSEKNVLKVDVQLFEKKLKTREKKIGTLEKSMKTLTEQNNTMKTYLKRIKSQMMVASTSSLDSHNMSGIASNGKIVKKIKAGTQKSDEKPANYRNKVVEKVIGNPFDSDT